MSRSPYRLAACCLCSIEGRSRKTPALSIRDPRCTSYTHKDRNRDCSHTSPTAECSCCCLLLQCATNKGVLACSATATLLPLRFNSCCCCILYVQQLLLLYRPLLLLPAVVYAGRQKQTPHHCKATEAGAAETPRPPAATSTPPHPNPPPPPPPPEKKGSFTQENKNESLPHQLKERRPLILSSGRTFLVEAQHRSVHHRST